MADGFQAGITVASASPVANPAVWDALPEPVVVAKANGTVLLANAAACSLLGWSAAELVGQPVDVLVPERLRPAVSSTVGRGWVDGAVRHRDGSEVAVSLAVSSAPGDVVVVAMRDSRAASRQWQRRRLESLSDLAGSLAHELNNLLAVVLSSAGFLAEAVASDEAAAADVERVRSAAERGARLTRRLLGVGSGEASSSSVAEPVALDELLADLAPLVERAGGAELRVLRAAGAWPVVRGDRRELEHLVLTLVLDDSPEQAVTVSASEVVLSGSDLSVPPGRYASIEVRCRPSTLALTTAYAIVKRGGGVLELEEDVAGSGSEAVVRLFLPAAVDVAPSSSTSSSSVDVRDVERRSVVLVVDDQAALRMLTARLLRRDGFTVLEAGSGAEALRTVEGNEIDVVLSDVVMPQMSGVELCEAVRALPDGPAVVLMSGYSDAVVGPQGAADGVPLLRKPFSEDQLLERVRASAAERLVRVAAAGEGTGG